MDSFRWSPWVKFEIADFRYQISFAQAGPPCAARFPLGNLNLKSAILRAGALEQRDLSAMIRGVLNRPQQHKEQVVILSWNPIVQS